MSEQFTPPEQALIERLGRAPQPELSTEARDAIRARMFDAMDTPPAPTPRLQRPLLLVALLVIGGLIAAGVLFAISQPPAEVTPTPQPTTTHTVIPATAVPAVISSPEPSATATLTVSPTSQLVVTASVTVSPTSRPVETATVTMTPTIQASVTAAITTITVIEGPVDQINDNIITIYDIPVQVSPDDPILPVIVVGDVVRIDGSTEIVDDQVVIVAITVTVTSVDVNTEPSTGTVWRDDGNCANPPPDWAQANGWRRRCEGQNNTGNPNNSNGNSNNGNGNQNEDDDDD